MSDLPSYETFRDIPYDGASDPRQALDLFLPSASGPASPDPAPRLASDRPLVVYIHAGAWRSGSKNDDAHNALVMKLKQSLRDIPFALLEYRLSPAVQNPAHVQDVVSGLSLLTKPELLDAERQISTCKQWDRSKVVLVGHSAGAFMTFELLLEPPATSARRWFEVPERVRSSIVGAVPFDGIFDLVALVNEYPSYAEFVEAAFGNDVSSWRAESVAEWNLPARTEAANDVIPQTNGKMVNGTSTTTTHEQADSTQRRLRTFAKILLLHSQQDELLTLRQPELMVTRLFDLLGGAEGFERHVTVDYETLRGTHFGILERDELGPAVRQFIDHNGW